MLHAAATITETTRLTGALTEEVQLCSSGICSADNLDLRDLRRVEWEDTLHALVCNDAADGDRFAHAATLTRDKHALEYLDTLLIAFDDAAVHVDRVTDIEEGEIALEVLSVDALDDALGIHRNLPFIEVQGERGIVANSQAKRNPTSDGIPNCPPKPTLSLLRP